MHGANNGIEDDEKDNAGSERKETSQDSAAETGDALIRGDSAKADGGLKKRNTGLFGKRHSKHVDENETGLQSSQTSTLIHQRHFTFASQIRGTLLNSWINVLLIMVPVGIALNYAKIDPVVIFVINFIAIIPLAAMLSYATEEIALRTGETLGGLLNATFG